MVIGKSCKNASAVLIYYKNKIFLQKRSKNKKIFYPAHWGCFGGAIKKNEPYKHAAVREIIEETNFSLDKDDLKLFYEEGYKSYFDRFSFIRKFFLLKIKNINNFYSMFALGEGEDAKFFDYKSYKKEKKIVPYDKFVIDLFFEKHLN